ncbi:MAG: uroporphyrinogen-III C-methyltransferase [Burkholderiales bacterium]|nr:uroporphyrinogen-III C-methyltransferase [Burkholderiales bacterium]MDP2396942.1 uroporphyrinogen-III C-methyltransferase [Burkholderiales bacterium]
MAGTVYLVGAGPGTPDLLTLRAARLLKRADIVFYDALVHPDTLALADKSEKIAVGKRCGRHSTAQRFINKRLVDAAQKHELVVRLKGGDPLLFGRAQEEIDELTAAGIRFEIVPGITAALAASAAVGTSMTRRGLSRNVAFVTPRTGAGEEGHDWAQTVLAADTCAIYMGVGEAAAIAVMLLARGASSDLPVVIVENASLPGERCLRMRLADLGSAAASGITGPAIILIGEVYAQASPASTACKLAERARAA